MSIRYIRPDLFAYPSRRSEVHARNVVCTSQPLATQAGLQALRDGGNAVDAALAAAICLTVVEPTGNGIGSDAFAIVSRGGELTGFNGSGRSPAAWSAERFAGHEVMPEVGWEAVTVPGAVDTWVQLSARFGALPFAELFRAGIHYAREGYALTPIIQRVWAGSVERYQHLDGFRDTFLPGGRAPAVGELVRCPDHASSLEAIAASGGEAFYRGELAAAICADAERHGATMVAADLAGHRGEWVEPVSMNYRGITLHELPPNGQGLAALIALGILDHLPLAGSPDDVDVVHLQIEAMKRAFVDTFAHVADPAAMTRRTDELLAPERLREAAAAIDPARAWDAAPASSPDRGTVYLCTADAEGTMVSMIQSNYMGFGSGIVVPGTGISLQNRGAGFSLVPGHPNRVAGGKRPYHTIIPGFLSRGGRPLGPIGVMGGHMQPQGHVQLVSRIEDFGRGLQESLDAPRWYLTESFTVALEDGFDPSLADALAARGHVVEPDFHYSLFGGAQAILAGEAGHVGASDPRKDGMAGGF